MEVDTCPHCGYPPTGRKQSPIFVWTARILAFAVILSLLLSLLSAFNLFRFLPLQTPDPFDDRDRGEGVAYRLQPPDRTIAINSHTPNTLAATNKAFSTQYS